MAENNHTINHAVASGGSYEVIRKRLEQQNKTLEQSIIQLNNLRQNAFGETSLEVIDRVRVRTENNCTPRDMVRIGQYLLFGYNVFLGLKKETQVEDVFALYQLVNKNGQYEISAKTINQTFLDDDVFVKQFKELYSYYKKTELIQLRVVDQKLLAAFKIGEKMADIRVFRWDIGNDGEVKYIDDRGERDIELPPPYDFEWYKVSREQFVHGRHPHANILDQVFVETVGGDLTIKVEDNTEDGEGIYQEAVEETNQSLEDADIYYAKLNSLILLKILPYKETQWRHFIFNTRNHDVVRVDALAHACVQLPNDHGIIFPGGYYLQTGEYKVFAESSDGLLFKRRWNAPNGEDVLYVFYEHVEGRFALYSYNVITKSLQNPIFGHGYSIFDDGKMIIFRSESKEPSRIHPMQIWQTPFASEEYAGTQPEEQSELATIGNAELVQGISELYSLSKLISEQQPSVLVYEELIKNVQRVLDGYYWLDSKSLGDFSNQLKTIGDTAELVLDEFEKVKSINQASAKALVAAQQELKQLLRNIQVSNWDTPEPFVDGLLQLKKQQGHLLSLREYRYIDLNEIDALSNQVSNEMDALGQKTVRFLSNQQAMKHYDKTVEAVHDKIGLLKTAKDLKPLLEELESMSLGLDALSEVINGLDIDDTLQKTAILESVSKVYSRINQTKAHAKLTIKEFSATESVAEFSAQLAVLSQSITSGVALADTPDACDEQLARLMIQLEEVESQFSDNESFLDEILNKREELYETFESRKQQLIDQRQRQAEQTQSAANRVLQSIERRSLKFTDNDQLNTYYSSDPMVHKVSELVIQLRDLDDSVKADDIEARLKAIKDQAIRSLRDKKDIFEDGGQTIKLGKHRFSVNTQPMDLTILPKDDVLVYHLSGTDYYEPVIDEQLLSFQPYWQQTMPSENAQVYRAEYLAYEIFYQAMEGFFSHTLADLYQMTDEQLASVVIAHAGPRYQEGYEKGVHDHDAKKIIKQLLSSYYQAPMLVYRPTARAIGMWFWLSQSDQKVKQQWIDQVRTAEKIATTLGSRLMIEDLFGVFQQAIDENNQESGMNFEAVACEQAARFLFTYLTQLDHSTRFQVSEHAVTLIKTLKTHLESIGEYKTFKLSLQGTKDINRRWQYLRYWYQGLVNHSSKANSSLLRYVEEAVVYELIDEVHFDPKAVSMKCEVNDLLGDHRNIFDRQMIFELDEFMERLRHFDLVVRPAYHQYRSLKQQLMKDQRSHMALDTFKARPLSSFVRNRLINDSYLPIIGDNLAKQMGALGQQKRSDLMGLLLLISPPGYGKTTLMEYIANRLGLNFMKINCPSLGHDVKSLDPGNAPNATARQELEKLNLALEMSNNVMLYLDDIQHTHPEFLQKFISLCDGTRKIDGVFKGESKTYDLRGKKFCVIMAGNPYTESGEVFKIPDMLANRADVYNLGDVLSGQDDIFGMSYIENALTSNQVLSPLALRDLNDLYLLMDMARGKEVATADLSHSYASSEINETTTVLKSLFQIQDVILKVNQEYIRSAAMDDKYRQEPPFKLQGSYRNMNKLAEKVVAVMDGQELEQLIEDHYVGEAQLLTTGAEENLLKLKELRGRLTKEEQLRWEQIKNEFRVRNAVAGDDADGATKIASQIAGLQSSMSHWAEMFNSGRKQATEKSEDQLSKLTSDLSQAISKLNLEVNVTNEPLPGLDQALASLSETMETSFIPVIMTMNKKLSINTEVLEKVTELSNKIQRLSQRKSTRTKTITNSAGQKNPGKE